MSVFSIVQHAGIFRIQVGKHLAAVFLVQRKKNFAVRSAVEGMAPLLQFCAKTAESVNFAIADGPAAVVFKGLHPLGAEPHNGKPRKSQIAEGRGQNAGVIRTAHRVAPQISHERFRPDVFAGIA